MIDQSDIERLEKIFVTREECNDVTNGIGGKLAKDSTRFAVASRLSQQHCASCADRLRPSEVTALLSANVLSQMPLPTLFRRSLSWPNCWPNRISCWEAAVAY